MSTIVISKSTKPRRAATYVFGSNHPKKKQTHGAPMHFKQVVEHEKIFSLSLNKSVIRSKTRHIPA